ncbi:MAG: tRNA uridine-5-carboxymethylaminomethyl(34) synthesis enzyme MnmG [Phycisphaerales bacterium]|nr:tRNA uridine-5-carboxymethylaminomethyl(34) synthesis enzyme MnmG [Phycisphaerales bacterium]
MKHEYQVIVVGGGHAGVEAAWAAANRLGTPHSVALVSLDSSKIGVMSCNPAIGGLAKGQLVREIDAMGGLMGLVADATGIQFKLLNTSKGAAVHGPRCQADNLAYARTVQAFINARPEIDIVEGGVERLLTDETTNGGTVHTVQGVVVTTPQGEQVELCAPAVVLTTGTFMRAIMHRGTSTTPGGRQGEEAANPISAALIALGLELGRLKTGTPPRIDRKTINWDSLPIQDGDESPTPFSELSRAGWKIGEVECNQFPLIEQISCRQTYTGPGSHDAIRANLDRAPMFSGQISSAGPRYCPSIEDKVVRFAEREQHGVYLEPESHETDWVYCNGIATSLPEDVQDIIVRSMPGCEHAKILMYGYAVEYDMVRPHQIYVTTQTRSVNGFFLAGQINGTSGYEEAAAQGLVAGINAAMYSQSAGEFSLDRSQGYIGVLMDDLVTKTPREPYRMFTSRAEYRLLLRSDNAPDRLTPIAIDLGLLDHHDLGSQRKAGFARRTRAIESGRSLMESTIDGQKKVCDRVLEPDYSVHDLQNAVGPALTQAVGDVDPGIYQTLHAHRRYEPYVKRQVIEIRRHNEMEHKPIPEWIEYESMDSLRNEARGALGKFRPTTFGQASRLEGVTPADLTLLSVLVKRARLARRETESLDIK